MKIDDWLSRSETALKSAGIGTARLDCLVLLEDETGKDRSWLIAHPEFELTTGQIKSLDKKIEKRAKHMPLAYVRQKTEFYGRSFYIDERVLEPRPESETMIELLQELVASHQSPVISKDSKPQKGQAAGGWRPATILDIGTGSGALAITAKLEFPSATVIATDIDPQCLAVARKNATNHQTEIEFLKGNLLQPLRLATSDWQLAAVLANLPYVPDNYELNDAAMNEPRSAIFGGPDGLDYYRNLFNQLHGRASFVLTESLPFQHKELQKIAEQANYQLHQEVDLIQVFGLA